MSLAEMPRKVQVGVALVVALAFFAFMQIGISGVDAWTQEGVGNAEDFETLGDALFDEHVLAFEVLGILLTAAMIGAMIIARPLGAVDDATNYPSKIRGAELAAVQDVSDVDRNMGGGNFIPMDLHSEEEE